MDGREDVMLLHAPHIGADLRCWGGQNYEP